MNLKPLTIAGLTGTIAWAGFVWWYLERSNQLSVVLSSPPNNFGDFWAGTFAPLAFWWLVLGYFQQGIELRQNVEALEQQSAETANLVLQAQAQADAVRANELHARTDTFFRYAELVVSQLTSISGDFAISMTPLREDKARIQAAFSAGNKDLYFDLMFDRVVREREQYLRWIQQHARRERYFAMIDRYMIAYESLLRRADPCDPDGAIRSAYESSPMGRLYLGLCIQEERAPVIVARERPHVIEDI